MVTSPLRSRVMLLARCPRSSVSLFQCSEVANMSEFSIDDQAYTVRLGEIPISDFRDVPHFRQGLLSGLADLAVLVVFGLCYWPQVVRVATGNIETEVIDLPTLYVIPRVEEVRRSMGQASGEWADWASNFDVSVIHGEAVVAPASRFTIGFGDLGPKIIRRVGTVGDSRTQWLELFALAVLSVVAGTVGLSKNRFRALGKGASGFTHNNSILSRGVLCPQLYHEFTTTKRKEMRW